MDFWKRITGFYMHSVCLPEEVTKHFYDLAGQLLELRCPGRGTWHVGLVRMGDKLVLQPGWSSFAGSNNVWQNDLLHFKFVRGSTFEVQIFDSCGWEICGDIEGETNEVETQEEGMPCHSSKKRSWSKNNNSLHPTKRIKTIEVEVQETMPCHSSKKRSWSKNNNSLHLTKKIKNSEFCILCQEDEIPDSKEEQTVPSQNNEEFLQSDNTNEVSSLHKNNTLDEDQLNEERNNGLPVTKHHALLGRYLGLLENGQSETAIPDFDILVDYLCGPLVRQTMSAGQKARANSLAHKIQGSNPAFVCLLQQSCTTKNSCVYVPKEFSAVHLQEVNQKILLCRSEREKTWSVDYYRIGRRIRGTSWLKFVKENNLQKGDLCMFELIATAEQITFVVHVSRAT